MVLLKYKFMSKTMTSPINTIKIFLLCLLILHHTSSNAQVSSFRYLDLNTILKDKKIQLAKSQLLSGWTMRANGSNFYIERT